MAKLTKLQLAERTKVIEELRALLPPGSTVHCILRHVSRSGMYRAIDLRFLEGGATHRLSYRVGKVLGFGFDEKREAVKAGGCGMDMGFHLVSNLSTTLYPDGFGCIGEGKEGYESCPSSDHSNGDRDYTPHSEERPHWHESGGYALRCQWL
jgi:hypothetical protein